MVEKRRAERRPILETFSLFATIPKRGGYKLPIHDVSKVGLSLDIDTEGETLEDHPIQKGEDLEVCLYLNQTLYIPLSVKVVRIIENDSVRTVGAEVQTSPGAKALTLFIDMLDKITGVAEIKE